MLRQYCLCVFFLLTLCVYGFQCNSTINNEEKNTCLYSTAISLISENVTKEQLQTALLLCNDINNTDMSLWCKKSVIISTLSSQNGFELMKCSSFQDNYLKSYCALQFSKNVPLDKYELGFAICREMIAEEDNMIQCYANIVARIAIDDLEKGKDLCKTYFSNNASNEFCIANIAINLALLQDNPLESVSLCSHSLSHSQWRDWCHKHVALLIYEQHFTLAKNTCEKVVNKVWYDQCLYEIGANEAPKIDVLNLTLSQKDSIVATRQKTIMVDPGLNLIQKIILVCIVILIIVMIYVYKELNKKAAPKSCNSYYASKYNYYERSDLLKNKLSSDLEQKNALVNTMLTQAQVPANITEETKLNLTDTQLNQINYAAQQLDNSEQQAHKAGLFKTVVDAQTYLKLGNVYFEMKQYPMCIKYYHKAQQADSNSSYPYNNIGVVYNILHDYIKAIQTLNKAVEINPKDEKAWYNMGASYFYKKQYKHAVWAYNKSIAINNKNEHSLYNLGCVYIANQDYSSAITILRKALSLNENYENAIINLGVAYDGVGDEEKAINLYNGFIKQHPHSVASWYNLGLLYSKHNKHEQARSCFNKTISLKPDHKKAKDALVLLNES